MQGSTALDIVVEGLSLIEGEMIVNFSRTYGPLTVRIIQENTTAVQKSALMDLYYATNGPSWDYFGAKYVGWGDNNTDPCSLPWVRYFSTFYPH